MDYISVSPEQTEEIGARVAREILEKKQGEKSLVCLFGGLGAGKTVFVRGFAAVLSPGSRVKSPTYTLVNEYRKGPVPLFHFDLYRAESEADLQSLGAEDYLRAGHCIVEWSENLPEIPEDAWLVTIQPKEDGSRIIRVQTKET